MAPALPRHDTMPAIRRERRQRETMAPLSLTETKPEPVAVERDFSEDEEAFFRAGDQLADAPQPSSDL